MNAWQMSLDVRHAQAVGSDARAALQTLIGHLDALMGERIEIAEALRQFHQDPLSDVAMARLLRLAETMTPALAPTPSPSRRDRILS